MHVFFPSARKVLCLAVVAAPWQLPCGAHADAGPADATPAGAVASADQPGASSACAGESISGSASCRP